MHKVNYITLWGSRNWRVLTLYWISQSKLSEEIGTTMEGLNYMIHFHIGNSQFIEIYKTRCTSQHFCIRDITCYKLQILPRFSYNLSSYQVLLSSVLHISNRLVEVKSSRLQAPFVKYYASRHYCTPHTSCIIFKCMCHFHPVCAHIRFHLWFCPYD